MSIKDFWQWLIGLFSSPVPTPPPAPFPPPVKPPPAVPPPTPPATDPPPIVPPPPVVTPPPVVVPPVATPPPPPPPPVTPKFRYPAQIVGPKWKVTLESGKDIKLPELATYSDSNFRVSDDGHGAMLRCHYGSGTTPNSKNSRCEWREMSSDGKSLASWSSTSGHHQMNADFTADRLMDARNHVVVAQIHDDTNDLTVFRLEGTKLWITSGNTAHIHLVTSDFRLGVRHSVGFDVSNGVVSYTYDGKLVPFTQKIKASGLYYRHGCYAQANPDTAPGGKKTDYAQVTTFGLTVSHS